MAKESAFTNPASAAGITDTSAFIYWDQPSVPAFGAHGRNFSVGASDGGSDLKGAFAYTRSSLARVGTNDVQVYDDRSEFRFATGMSLSKAVSAGLATRYVNRHGPGESKKFFQADLGIIFPVFAGIAGGITYENLFNKEDELPPTLAAGAHYLVAGTGLGFYADGYRLMKGTKQGERGWSLAAEMTVVEDLKARAARFQDAYRRFKGWSFGLSWSGPRLSLDYAFRTAGGNAREKDHILGLTTSL